MKRVTNVPALRGPLNPTFNPQPSFSGNFSGTGRVDGTIDNGAYQYTGLVKSESASIEPPQDWFLAARCQILQRIRELTAVKNNVDAELGELQAQYHNLQDPMVRQRAHEPFTAQTTPNIPFASSPYPAINISAHSFTNPTQMANWSISQGEAWDIPSHAPLAPSMQPYIPDAQPQIPTNLPANCTVFERDGKRVFLCECGHETSRKGDLQRHRESLAHAKKNYACHCGRRYTRRDGLARHVAKCPVY